MKPDTRQDYHQRMLRVLVHIQDHLDGDLDLAELAAVAHFSLYHFHRIFRGMVGESLRAYVRRLRLERAARHLRDTRDPVLTVALAAGFESHAAFTRAFKSMTGRAPSSWRAGRASVPAAPSGLHYGSARLPVDFRPLTEKGRTMDVTIVDTPPRRVAFVRHVGPYEQCRKAWETLCTTLGAEGRLGAGSDLIGLCHDDPEVTPAERIRYDACATVDDDFQPHGEIGVQTLAGGPCARTTHQGPYADLKHTYAALFGQWLPSSGRRCLDGPCFEIYLNDPESTEPQDLLVDILIPLEA